MINFCIKDDDGKWICVEFIFCLENSQTLISDGDKKFLRKRVTFINNEDPEIGNVICPKVYKNFFESKVINCTINLVYN